MVIMMLSVSVMDEQCAYVHQNTLTVAFCPLQVLQVH